MPKVLEQIETLEAHTELKTQDEQDAYDIAYTKRRMGDIINTTKYDLEPGQEVMF